jgi:uncharacterized protein VirK/YbjX
MPAAATNPASAQRLPGLWHAVAWAWRRGDEGGGISRMRLVWRACIGTLTAGRALQRWMAVSFELHARGLVGDQPGEYLRAIRPHVNRHTDYTARVVQLIDHVDWLESAFKAPALESLLAGRELVLAELQPPRGYDFMRLQLRAAPVASPEGELVLTLVLQRSPDVQHKAMPLEAVALAFSVFRIEGMPCLAIGGVRGARHPVLRMSAVETSQALCGWKPSVLAVRVAQELARYWNLQLVGLNPSSHRLQGWTYQWQRRHREAAERIWSSYDALWDHFQASKGPPGWMVLPLHLDEKLAATALSPERRERQIRRADFWLRIVRRLKTDAEQLLTQPGREARLTRFTQSVQPSSWDGWGKSPIGSTLGGDGFAVPSRALETGPGGLE